VTAPRDELGVLHWQFTLASQLADFHLPHLTDDACFWAPAPGAWTVRRGDDDAWRPDWAEVEPDPAPAVTIGWLSWHLIWWLSDLNAALRGEARSPREQCLWPGSADAAVTRVRALLAELEASYANADLARPVAYPWLEPRELRQVFAWANAELMKNVAEIGVLRLAFEASRRAGG